MKMWKIGETGRSGGLEAWHGGEGLEREGGLEMSHGGDLEKVDEMGDIIKYERMIR